MGTCSRCGATCLECASIDHAAAKDAFHKRAKDAMHTIAKRLSLTKGQYEVASIKGGPAIMGEVIIQAPWFYASWSGDHGGFFRKTTPNDPYGVRYPNHQFTNDEEPDEIASRIAALKPRLKKRSKRTAP